MLEASAGGPHVHRPLVCRCAESAVEYRRCTWAASSPQPLLDSLSRPCRRRGKSWSSRVIRPAYLMFPTLVGFIGSLAFTWQNSCQLLPTVIFLVFSNGFPSSTHRALPFWQYPLNLNTQYKRFIGALIDQYAHRYRHRRFSICSA